MSSPLKVGDTAPDFELLTQDKKPIRLSDLRGKTVMLLFYPFDFSSVCTTEHCAFGPQIGRIQKRPDVVVFGVNCDSIYCHAAFKKQYNIPYDLLSDISRKMCQDYGMFSGDPYYSAKRGTVVIDPEGKIAHYEAVPPREARSVESLAALV